MAWLSVTLETDCAHAEALADALMEGGALSATIEDAAAGTAEEKPQFGEPGSITTPGWDRSRIAALFDPAADIAACVAAAADAVGLAERPSYSVEEVAEQNWVQLTQSQFEPIRISDRLWIVPSWHDAPDPDAVNLVLDPGMAFGTGSHPTTRLCLEWLERSVQPGQSLLDYGCGSGILAIAAAKLGAVPVTGVDIDPQAVVAAEANAERNAVSARFLDSAAPLAGQFDLVVANILANPLRALAPAICGYVRAGGHLALSGILAEQAAELIDIYAPWIPLAVADTREGWVCLAGRKPGGSAC
ncbi:50S ribosomal protein L11 methyltransferase [Azospira restricta]|uniref:Ribosomal protein L11 methyltransferase n=1 Tax=Azospira restricta TaxID=404405 RepID=A0A974Y3R8_9RHOO|nr:50S ribosomal protein L11 methyltransferase [Azospira restricta]QRJ64039.1 50S ribosomal protein L11 methyltransferase [Azospira restricta]